MSRYVIPENIETLRAAAWADIAEAVVMRGHCDCEADDSCWPHRVLSLTDMTVEAWEPWGVAS